MFAILIADENYTSNMVYGGYDSTQTQTQIDWLPLINESQWEVNLTLGTYGGQTFFQGGTPAIFDTSTAIIYMPEADVQQLTYQISNTLGHLN